MPCLEVHRIMLIRSGASLRCFAKPQATHDIGVDKSSVGKKIKRITFDYSKDPKKENN